MSEWADRLRRLGTPLGRRELVHALFHAGWPALRTLAAWHRATLIRRTRVIAVIGSLGKTTTTRFVWRALGEPGRPPVGRNAGSFLARELYRIRPWSRWAVLEVGISGFGRMREYARMIRPDVVVVTAIASDHSRTFETLDETREEKARMVAALPPHGVAVLNGDDPHARRMAETTRARIVTFGYGPDNDVVGRAVRPDWPNGSVLEVEVGGRRIEARTRLFGRHSAYAVLVAVAVGLETGCPLEEIVGSVAGLAPTNGRMQPVRLPGGAWLIRDEYKSSVESVEAAIEALAEVPARRRIVVLGEITEPPSPQRQTYRAVGAGLAQVADHVVLVTGSTGFQDYRSGIRTRRPDYEPVHVRSWREAVETVEPGPGDVVLVKGRGSQRLARISLAFLDQDVGCDLVYCDSRYANCDHCPALTSGRSRSPMPAAGAAGPTTAR